MPLIFDGHGDIAIFDAGVLGHDEGRRAHDWRQDLPAHAGRGLDRAGDEDRAPGAVLPSQGEGEFTLSGTSFNTLVMDAPFDLEGTFRITGGSNLKTIIVEKPIGPNVAVGETPGPVGGGTVGRLIFDQFTSDSISIVANAEIEFVALVVGVLLLLFHFTELPLLHINFRHHGLKIVGISVIPRLNSVVTFSTDEAHALSHRSPRWKCSVDRKN